MKKISEKINILLNWFFIDLKLIKENIKLFKEERKKIKNLEYYYITQDNKTTISHKKDVLFNLLFKDVSYKTIIYLSLAILTLIVGIIILLTIIILFLFSIVYSPDIDLMTYSFTILIFVSLLSLIIIFAANDIAFFLSMYLYFNAFFLNISISFPNIKLIYKINVYLIVTLVIHFILLYVSFPHILKKLNNITKSFPFFVNFFVFFIIINFYPDNTPAIEINIINSIATTLIISYTLGRIIINYKIRVNENKAKTLFRTMIKDSSKINYHSLVECAYYGGEEYENLMLNNEQMKNIIIEEEANMETPKESPRKAKIIKYFKNFFSTIYTSITNLFNKFKS